mmetsp:Transcript_38693/g.57549  ORF Transcript_38693/g.57549 Transcript_38693/m.57549 type:complete len:86 (-) Transcript_38693:34-291(-)
MRRRSTCFLFPRQRVLWDISMFNRGEDVFSHSISQIDRLKIPSTRPEVNLWPQGYPRDHMHETKQDANYTESQIPHERESPQTST